MKQREGLSKKIGLIIILVIFLFPVFLLLIQSMAFSWRWGTIFPPSFDWRGWQVLAQEPRLMEAICTTLWIGAVVVFLNLLIAFPAGKALAHHSFKGKSTIETLLFMPILVPSLAIAMGVHMTMIRIGLADYWFGVVGVHLIPTVPYSIRILRAGYERLGVKWLEQAQSLGASEWTVFRTVTLPQLLPSIRATIFLVFVISLSQYILTAIIGGGHVVTLSMIYFPYFYSVDSSVIASFSLLFAIIPILFLAVIEVLIRLLIPYQRRIL